jgi:hypothetical protein
MSRTSTTESLLALFAGRARAAAIVGDLTEMAAVRGRLWFTAAYLRTLFSLTWRILLALVVATISRQIIVNSSHIYISHTIAAWYTSNNPLHSMGGVLYCMMTTFWFVLPFAAVRYGMRDRFVQLTFAVAVGTTLAFFVVAWASLLCVAATIALAAVVFTSSPWRKPLAVLLCTVAALFLTIPPVNAVDTVIFSYDPAGSVGRTFHHYGPMVAFRGSLLVVAFVCSRMHTRLLSPRFPGGIHVKPA